MTTTPTSLLSLFDPAARANPYPIFNAVREAGPQRLDRLPVTAFGRYDDCSAVLRDPRASSDRTNAAGYDERAAALAEAGLDEFLGRQPFLFLDPPDHTRLRGLVSKAFTPRRIAALRPRVEQIVGEILDLAAETGRLEIVEDLAYPLPVRIISELLGVPDADHERFRGWSHDLVGGLDPTNMLGGTMTAGIEQRLRASEDFRAYFRELIAQRRSRPGDDLLSALVGVEAAGDSLTEDELLTTCILLLVAGHETTVNLIANGVLALLRHPDQLAALVADPALIGGAVEETLRYDPPVQLTGRTALADIDVGGVTVPKGHIALLLIGAANRDPAEFADPGRFDIGRADAHHLSFALGPHYCLGAPLARLEGEVALGALARRLVEPALAVADPPYKETITLRGLAELPVTFAGIRTAG